MEAVSFVAICTKAALTAWMRAAPVRVGLMPASASCTCDWIVDSCVDVSVDGGVGAALAGIIAGKINADEASAIAATAKGLADRFTPEASL
jgi:hypothetical protein